MSGGKSSISPEELYVVRTLAETQLKKERLRHCLAVGDVLLKLYPELTAEEAEAIGLLHDIAHHWDEEHLFSYIKENNIDVTEDEMKIPRVLHAPCGAHIATVLIHDCPDSWFKAIRWHTVGSVEMGELGKALYVADFIEPNRKHLTDEQRRAIMKEKTLSAKLLAVLHMQLKYFAEKGFKNTATGRELVEALEAGRF